MLYTAVVHHRLEIGAILIQRPRCCCCCCCGYCVTLLLLGPALSDEKRLNCERVGFD